MSSRVVLHVYDLSRGLAANMSMALIGQHVEGIWHTGVVVFGLEYYFGGGIQAQTPARFAAETGQQPTKRIDLGTTTKTQSQLQDFLRSINAQWTPESYHLLDHNCNNFSDVVARFLLNGQGIPEDIVNLPRFFESTPLGAMMRPFVETFQRQALSAGGALDPFAVASAAQAQVSASAAQRLSASDSSARPAHNAMQSDAPEGDTGSPVTPHAQPQPSVPTARAANSLSRLPIDALVTYRDTDSLIPIAPRLPKNLQLVVLALVTARGKALAGVQVSDLEAWWATFAAALSDAKPGTRTALWMVARRVALIGGGDAAFTRGALYAAVDAVKSGGGDGAQNPAVAARARVLAFATIANALASSTTPPEINVADGQRGSAVAVGLCERPSLMSDLASAIQDAISGGAAAMVAGGPERETGEALVSAAGAVLVNLLSVVEASTAISQALESGVSAAAVAFANLYLSDPDAASGLWCAAVVLRATYAAVLYDSSTARLLQSDDLPFYAAVGMAADAGAASAVGETAKALVARLAPLEA